MGEGFGPGFWVVWWVQVGWSGVGGGARCDAPRSDTLRYCGRHRAPVATSCCSQTRGTLFSIYILFLFVLFIYLSIISFIYLFFNLIYFFNKLINYFFYFFWCVIMIILETIAMYRH